MLNNKENELSEIYLSKCPKSETANNGLLQHQQRIPGG